MDLITFFILLVTFQLKHFLADYPFQTPYMLKKFSSGWDWIKPLASHAAVHAIFTFIIAFNWLFSWQLPLYLAAFDFIVHFAMDRIKASPNLLGRYKALSADEFKTVMRNVGYKGRNHELKNFAKICEERLRSNKLFWWSLGLDQMVHHITDLIIAFAICVAVSNVAAV